ncbi:hypothetical protein MPSEU_000526200 [Mayamaea pseudoterrestris]|nr:hypothetical protein MPSEU_000526200 [Mayamaea pseudoterrestris]
MHSVSASSIDNPRLVLLTHKQHVQCSITTIYECAPTTRNDRNEQKNLWDIVAEERALCQRALVAFCIAWEYVIASATLRLHQSISSYKPTRFGACRQVIIMMDSANKFAGLKWKISTDKWFTTQTVFFAENALPPVPTAVLPSTSFPTTAETQTTITLFRNDFAALELAKQHAADVMLTAASLRALCLHIIVRRLLLPLTQLYLGQCVRE